MSDRVLLLMPTTTYKATDFLHAAERVGAEVTVGSDQRQALEAAAPDHTLTLGLNRAEDSVADILSFAARRPLRAVIGTDDETTTLAALAAEALGLPHNPVDAVRATRNKHETRRRLSAAGMPGPVCSLVPVDEQAELAARRVEYPCVLKPLALSASRGVLRANDPREFVTAFHRVRSILRQPDVLARGNCEQVLVEDYLPGDEIALEGLVVRGRLQVLALFDKPDSLVGPTFEETMFVTPSRLPESTRARVVEEARRGCHALGIVEGPVHAEFRIHEGQPTLLELAPRTIGGLCSRTLRFGAGLSLEELVLCHAMGGDTAGLGREAGATGVLMIPIPAAGVLRNVDGVDEARALPGVGEITLTLHRGAELVPLPEGHRYLGFIFAHGDTPQDVERTLRQAHATLRFDIDRQQIVAPPLAAVV